MCTFFLILTSLFPQAMIQILLSYKYYHITYHISIIITVMHSYYINRLVQAPGHKADRHLPDRHLADGHLLDRYLADGHLPDRYLADRHLPDRHLADGHLPNRYLADGHFEQTLDRNTFGRTDTTPNGHLVNIQKRIYCMYQTKFNIT